MPNPKLETYKNKATGTVYDFTDADAQSKISATVDLLKDTTGWLGKNRCPITITNQTQVGVGLVVNADKSVTLNGTPTGNYSFPLGTVTNFNIGDKFVISGCPNGGGENTYNIFVVCRDSNNTSLLAVSQYGADVTFTVPANTVKIDVYARVVNGSTISNKTFYTMIDTPEQHSLSPTYEPYHESVEEMLDGKADDMCTTGNHTLYMIATAITPSNGQPEFFIPWSNPKKKNITLGNNFEVYMRKNSSWTKLTWSANPVITRAENGFYVGLTLDEALTPEEVFGFRVQGDIVFS